AESVDASIEPEAQDRVELGPNLVVRPVEVGLLGREQVEIPLTGRAVGLGDPRPRRPAEHALPVVGSSIAARPMTGTEDVAAPLRASRAGRQGGAEPGVLD